MSYKCEVGSSTSPSGLFFSDLALSLPPSPFILHAFPAVCGVSPMLGIQFYSQPSCWQETAQRTEGIMNRKR